MLEASVRNLSHMKKGLDLAVELITAPAKVYMEWFAIDENSRRTMITENSKLQEIPNWQPTQELLSINSIDDFMKYITDGLLNINHELTDKGIDRFAADWSAIIV
jgi:transaldolase